jgi:hypothetical protein
MARFPFEMDLGAHAHQLWACSIRFSKTVSLKVLVPSAVVAAP